MTAGEHEHESSDVGGAPQIVDESEMPTVGSVQLPSDEEILYDLRPSWVISSLIDSVVEAAQDTVCRDDRSNHYRGRTDKHADN